MANIDQTQTIQQYPFAQRQFLTVENSTDTGTLWERIDGKAVEKSFVASYARVPDIDQGWLFTRIYQQPMYVQASSLQLACIRFLQEIGVRDHIRVVKGTPDTSTLD